MNKEQSITFIEKCKCEGRKILGIERFEISDEGKIPDMNYIADFSDTTLQSSISSAFAFIRNSPDGYFEFDTK